MMLVYHAIGKLLNLKFSCHLLSVKSYFRKEKFRSVIFFEDLWNSQYGNMRCFSCHLLGYANMYLTPV